MPLFTKRWSDRLKKTDGFRILICTSKPTGVAKDDEAWDEWYPELAPSKALHAAFRDKTAPLPWEEFRRRYLEEMQSQEELVDGLADLVAEGKTITLLCSSSCSDEKHCHRSILKDLVDEKASRKELAKAT